MTEKKEDKEKSGLGWKMWLGIGTSFVYACGAVFILFINLCYSPPSPPLGLNGIGDYLAGAFSPLAFLWLVIGYLMQNKELRNNNEAIKLQINELKSTTDLSNRNLDLQEEQWKIKKALDHNRAQPKLYCYNHHFVINKIGENYYNLRTTINNKGASVNKLMIGIHSLNEKNENEITPVLISHIAKDTTEEYVTNFKSNKNPTEEEIDLIIPVRYSDENDFYQTTNFHITLYLQGHKWNASSDFGTTAIQPE